MRDLVLFPHCDVHVALNGAPALSLSVFARDTATPATDPLTLANVTASCTFEVFAPHNAVGNRFQAFATIAQNGLVTPTAVGTNLVQVRHDSHYMVFRLQVHDRILGWWFGNGSITTARDTSFPTSQPSIYALFSDDASGTDIVGDITGHGYVPLTSQDPAVFTVGDRGRLQGVAEGSGTLQGDFLGVRRTLPVRVVDYAKRRDVLEPVRAPNLANASSTPNMLFVGEGFRDSADDRRLFDKIVTEAVDDLFTSNRHQPYGLLEGSFNVFKVHAPSQQHGTTVAYRVDTGAATVSGETARGTMIPYEYEASEPPKYTIAALVRRVGLPKRNEARTAAAIIAEWSGQGLPDFDPARVDDATVAMWKTQKAAGLLEARDTFFGLHFGNRFADRRSGFAAPPVTRPATETAGAPLRAFIARVYEWFDLRSVARSVTPDPRRQAVERFRRSSNDRHHDTITSWYASLHYRYAPHQNIGAEWVPDPTAAQLRPSVGLVGIILHDQLNGGTSIGYATANSLNSYKGVDFNLTTTGNERTMRRALADRVDVDLQDCIDTLAHEFGHALGLGDEYESSGGDDPEVLKWPGVDEFRDNLARIGAIYANGTVSGGTLTLTDRKLDPDKVKWLDLLRTQLSARTVAPSVQAGANLEVKIDPRQTPRWTAAKAEGLEAFLRARDIPPDGRQLPLKYDDAHYLVRLVIERVDEATGTIALGGPELPPAPFPVFPVGSLLFVPRRHEDDSLRYVVEKKVRETLNTTRLPLNEDPDTTRVNRGRDSPVSISGFKGPCKSYKTIGVYEGGGNYAAGYYRPAGLCKMRASGDIDGPGEGEFCFVCRYLLVSRIDPGLLDVLDNNQYPGAKKGDG